MKAGKAVLLISTLALVAGLALISCGGESEPAATTLAAGVVAAVTPTEGAVSPPSVPHPVQGQQAQCLNCHRVGGPGVGARGGIGMPANHQDLAPPACLDCHKPA